MNDLFIWSDNNPERKVYLYKLNDDGTMGERVEVSLNCRCVTPLDLVKRVHVAFELTAILNANNIVLSNDEDFNGKD